MRTCYKMTFSIAAALSLSGCFDRSAHQEAAAARDNTQAVAVSAGSGGPSFEYPLGSDDATAYPLAAGSFMTGTLPAREGKPLTAFSVQIGNYSNSSDGNLLVELCQGDRCQSGRSPLAASVDNAYLDIPLAAPLEVDGTAVVRYRIAKVDGAQPVAIWLYPPAPGLTSIKVNEQVAIDRMPRIGLRF